MFDKAQSGAKAGQSYKAWQILQNEPLVTLVAKIGFDTAESGPSKVRVTGISTPVYRCMPWQMPKII